MTIVCARLMWCVNGVINRVFLSAIRVRKESPMANRLIGRIFVRIYQKSRASVRHFREARIQTLIAAMGGPDLTISAQSGCGE